METPADTVHIIAPENLPPDLAPAAPAFDPKVFDRARKVQIVAELIKSGKPVSEICAKYPPISPPQLRGWSNAYNVEAVKLLKAEEGKTMEETSEEKTTPPVSTEKPKPRRTFTEKEKILYAVRYNKLKKQGMGVSEGSKQLGVHETQLREWVKQFEAMKPQMRGAYARIEAGNHGVKRGTKRTPPAIEARHRDASAMVDRGVDMPAIAAKFKVHRDSIKAWWHKVNPGKKWVATRPGGAGGHFTRPPRKPYGKSGPNKMTRAKMSVREAVLSNSVVLSAQHRQMQETEELNGNAQPISMGKATHDAIIFLKMARDLASKNVKSGAMQVDDPLILFPMLALNALSK